MILKRLVCALMIVVCGSQVSAADWPQWGGPKRDIVWRESDIVEKLPTDGLLPRMWSLPVGEGYSGPAVAAGRVFVTDLFKRSNERILCIDAESGKLNWKHEYPVRYTISYPAGPRTTPTVDGDRVYSLGAMGDLLCLNVSDGDVVWETNFVDTFGTRLPIWGMAASPLIDGDNLIALVGGKDNALVVAFNKNTGKEVWRALSNAQVGYAPPVIYEFGGRRQLIVWHPAAVVALDPATGKEIWNVPFRVQAGLTVPMPRKIGNRLFVTAFYNGPMMLKVTDSSAEIVWKGSSNSEIKTDGLHSIMPTPWVTESHIYGVCSYGQLRCLNSKTGERIWETRQATGEGRWWNAFLIPHEDRVFIHNEQGELIIAQLEPTGYKELSRAQLVEPTRAVRRRMTIWSHPAFAMQSVFARNDKEIVRVNLRK